MSDHGPEAGTLPVPLPDAAETAGPPLLADEIRRILTGKRIEAAIPSSLRKQGLKVEDYERMGGLTNRNYKLNRGGNAVVLRLPGWGTARFIDRSSERANQEAAALAGFTPQSIYFNDRTGVKITRFFPDAKALDARDARLPQWRDEVALLLGRFHSSGLVFAKRFDGFAMARTYERIASGRLARFYRNFAKVKARVMALEEPLSSIGATPVACHNDLVPENILRTASGLTLIDWEYSGMNDPAWDLASFFIESGFGPGDEEAFLSAYKRQASCDTGQDLQLRISAFKLLQDYLWSLWSLLQEGSSHSPEGARYYRNYGTMRYARAIARLPSIEGRLGLASPEEGGKQERKGRGRRGQGHTAR